MKKKPLLLSGIACAIAIAYLGTTWAIKQRAQPFLDQHQTELLLLKQFPRAKIDKIEIVSDGFFSTTRKIILSANTDCFPELTQFKGDQYILTETWHYGLLPLAATFKPSLIAVKGELTADEATFNAWGMAHYIKGTQLANYTARVSLDQSFQVDIATPSINYQDTKEKFIWNGLNATISGDMADPKIYFNIQSNDLQWQYRDTIHLKGFTLSGFKETHASGALLSEAQLNLEEASIASIVDQKQFNDLSFKLNTKVEKDMWQANLSAGFGHGTFGTKGISQTTKLGESNINISLNQVRLKSFGDFMKIISTPSCIIGKPSADETTLTLHRLSQRLQQINQNLLQILDGKPKLDITQLKFTIDDIPLVGNGSLHLEGVAPEDLYNKNQAGLLRGTVGELTLKVKQKDLIALLIQQKISGLEKIAAQQGQPLSSEQKNKHREEAQTEIAALIDVLINKNTVQKEADYFLVKVTTKGGAVKLNDQTLGVFDAVLADEAKPSSQIGE